MNRMNLLDLDNDCLNIIGNMVKKDNRFKEFEEYKENMLNIAVKCITENPTCPLPIIILQIKTLFIFNNLKDDDNENLELKCNIFNFKDTEEILMRLKNNNFNFKNFDFGDNKYRHLKLNDNYYEDDYHNLHNDYDDESVIFNSHNDSNDDSDDNSDDNSDDDDTFLFSLKIKNVKIPL